MLRVIQSNRLEELAGAIADGLPVGDPFARPTIVVSSRLVARWLQYELARRRGVTGALDLPFLEPFLERTFRTDGLRGLDRPRLAARVASALADPALLAEPALAPVRAYLAADGGDDSVRRVQLAARASALLWDYALNRPDWLDAWDDGRDADVGEVDPAALAWQRRLYDSLARIDADGVRWVPVPRLPQARRRMGLPPPVPTSDGAPVHLVGFSYLARAHLDALAALGGEVRVAMVTPCAEYWEDVPGRRRRGDAQVSDEPLALVTWGGPGRDTASMLLGASEGDVTEHVAEPEAPATALAAWSRDILHRAAPTTTGSSSSRNELAADAGVSVLACPSISRELEIAGSEIWRLLRADPSLRATDITILVAGEPEARARYLAQVGPVFGSLHRLPFHLIEAPASGSGRVAEAALELLELGLGRFTRRAMIALMTHPAVLARHPHVDPADWVRWCERLGIAHGAEAADHEGTYLEGAEAFHWTQGIRRLALGAFVAGERAGLDAAVALGGCELLPEELTPDQEPSAATFALLARSLIADARWLAGRAEPLRRWAEILPALVEAYLGDLATGGDVSAAAGARARVADVLRGLGELDLDGRLVPYREVVELARQRLGAMREGRGEPLAHGVMIAPLEPMRPLPSQVTFVVGLGEGIFPAGDQPSPLDLRTQRRRGDVAPRDRDRYGFLEALLAARRRVYLSYVARDEQSGDPRAPSSVIHELAEMLAPYLGVATAAEALTRLTIVHPLRRWDEPPDGMTSASPAAARERHAIEVRRSLDDHLRAARRAAPDAGRLRELLAAPELTALRERLRLDLADGVPPPGDDDDAPVVISLATLRKFLEAPVQAWAQVVLRLDTLDMDEDGADREDEPFDVTPRDRAAVLREVFALHLGAGGQAPLPLDVAYEKIRRRRALAGQAPLGLFGDAARHRDLERLERWQKELTKRGALGGPWQRIGFGRATTKVATLEKPVTLDLELRGRQRRIELVGTTELFGGADRERSIVLVNRDPNEEHRLRHAVDHLVLAAAGLAGGEREGLVLGEKTDVRLLAPWERGDAIAHLRTLIGDLLGGPHAYYLTLHVAKQALKGADLRKPTPNPSDPMPPLGWGPLDRDPGLVIPGDVAAIARRRLAPLLDREEKEK